MLLQLPISYAWSNALEFCLLHSIYAPHENHALQIQHFISLKLQNDEC